LRGDGNGECSVFRKSTTKGKSSPDNFRPTSMARTKSVEHNYFFTVSSTLFKETREFRVYARDPIHALNGIHKLLQKTRELDAKRKVIRPRLQPDQYLLRRLFLRYLDINQKTVESDLDLPNTANPDLHPQKRIRTETMSFGFEAENVRTPKPPRKPREKKAK
jgi:hypothetical protein